MSSRGAVTSVLGGYEAEPAAGWHDDGDTGDEVGGELDQVGARGVGGDREPQTVGGVGRAVGDDGHQ